MGSSASSLQNKAYKFMDCGCIYCYDFSNEDIQLLCHCHNCLQTLKSETFDVSIVCELENELSCCSVMSRSKMGWLSQSEAIQEAMRLKMRGIDEFLTNTNILDRYDIKCNNNKPYSKK